MADLKQIAENLIQGKAPQVKELVQKVADEGEDVQKILNEGLLAGMNVVGELMLIIGEKINTTSKEAKEIVARKDTKALQDLAKRQIDAGACIK